MQEPEGRGQAAILRPAEAQQQIQVGRRAPGPDLAPYVDYFWWVRWNADPAHEQKVLPAPVVHLAAEWHEEQPRLMVVGVQRSTFVRTLAGEGHVMAAGFRPAGFWPFLGSSVGALTDREVPAAEILPYDDRAVAAELLRTGPDDDEMVAVLTAWLMAVGPEPDPLAAELTELVEGVEHDRSIVRAEQVATLAGTSLRTLQRRFSTYVGIGPKWVVQRFRLLDVAAAANSGEPVDWAGLAVDLGFADQSHLTRAFTAVVGQPPASYARRV